MFDRAIFSRGIHGLKNQQQSPAILRIKLFLHVAEQAHTSLQDVLGVLFGLDSVGVSGIKVREPEVFASCDAVAFNDPRCFFQVLAMFHDSGSVVQTCDSEQRAEAPTESGEAVVGME